MEEIPLILKGALRRIQTNSRLNDFRRLSDWCRRVAKNFHGRASMGPD
jgi:hypothetical protein